MARVVVHVEGYRIQRVCSLCGTDCWGRHVWKNRPYTLYYCALCTEKANRYQIPLGGLVPQFKTEQPAGKTAQKTELTLEVSLSDEDSVVLVAPEM